MSADSLVRHLPDLTGIFSQRMNRSKGLRSIMSSRPEVDPPFHGARLGSILLKSVANYRANVGASKKRIMRGRM
jgi:hypothetical protein